jgi:hypothetical protein
MTFPNEIKQWLNNRGITDEVIVNNKIDWDGNAIVIPIYDTVGKFLFNKYRRNPFKTEGPKYWYQSGQTSQLYNAHKINGQKQVIIVEGELDALILEARGYLAVTSTGGAGTFKDEWIPLLREKDLYVCFDKDMAGYQGAAKVLSKLPAKLIMLPNSVEHHGDVTDFFIKIRGDFNELLAGARSYPVLCEPDPEMPLVKNLIERIGFYKNEINKMQEEKRQASFQGKPYVYFSFLINVLNERKNHIERELRKRRFAARPSNLREEGISDNDIARAKEVLIETLYRDRLRPLGNTLVGLCPFHNERHSSFVIYLQQNKFYCFGACSKGGDAIDFLTRLEGISFIQAVRQLAKK